MRKESGPWLHTIMNNKELLYVIKPEQQNEQDLRALLSLHPEVKFVSLMGVDFRLRAYTDEKIAIDDFKAQQCDAVLMTGARARPFNKFAATIEAIGAVPTNDIMRNS